MMLVLAIAFVVIVNQLMARVLRSQMDESAIVMTTNLSDAAASYLASKDMLRLRTTVTKYARLSRVAYVFVRDREGEVIAHSSATFSPELKQAPTFAQDSQVSRRELRLEGKPIYETRAPILDGQLGSAYIGISADAVEREIYQALFMFVWPITFGTFCGRDRGRDLRTALYSSIAPGDRVAFRFTGGLKPPARVNCLAKRIARA